MNSFSQLLNKLDRKISRFFISKKIFNPWFYTPEGIDFTCDVDQRTKRSLKRLSKKSRAAYIRYFYTLPAFKIPVKKFLFKIKHGFYPPSMIAISPTKKCNLACRGCFCGEKNNDELSYDDVANIVRESNKMGLYMFVFIGGEPLCWKPLFKIIEDFPKNNFSIYTNGTLIDEKLAKKMARLGNISLGFSIEGFEKETDERRGNGVFKKVINAMEICRKEGVRISYSVTVTKYNSEPVTSDKFIDFMIEKGCFDGWYYQYMPIGDNPDFDLVPTPQQREQRRKRFAQLRKSKDINLFDFMNDAPLVGGCMCAGKVYVHINANGDVEPCVFYPFSVDNIHEKSLLEILKSPFFNKIRSYQDKTKNLLAPCPVIDHPEWLRETVETVSARPSNGKNEKLLDELKAPLDCYSKKYKEISDNVWKNEYKHD